MKTTKTKLAELKAKATKANIEYRKYLKAYNTEHDVERPHLSSEIIELYRKGKTKQEIIAMGYNKNYVAQQCMFFDKKKRVVKTQVASYFPKAKK